MGLKPLRFKVQAVRSCRGWRVPFAGAQVRKVAMIEETVQSVLSLDVGDATQVVKNILSMKPEIAQAVVAFAVPALVYPPTAVLSERRSCGIIKSFSHQSGFGFIECPELRSSFGNDVFLHKNQLGSFDLGVAVTFAVALNKDGKPQAYDLKQVGPAVRAQPIVAAKRRCVQSLPPNHYGFPPQPLFYPGVAPHAQVLPPATGVVNKRQVTAGGRKKKSTAGAGVVKQHEGAKQNEVGNEQRELGQYTGNIKSFNIQSGYGFIECSALKGEGFANDVFLHHVQKAGMEVGQCVEFTAYLNGNGKPQAKDLVDQSDAASKRMRPS
eukprot:NODE_11171_length_1303_cov_4.365646.p1 GENE.NODE_11171_length_1303_cov_4.365646~~NODE_11171_length_1303_cov_4.365646.p1  ORF type:complete len:324 (+),score=73.01 NODE_11171_length_1303_cov_4.365646:88-1059(+)